LSTSAETDFALPRRARLHIGDLALRGIAGAAALTVMIVLILIAYKVTQEAWDAISTFGLGFLTSSEWNAVTNQYGARDLIWGTAVTSFFALLFAVPISIAIGLFLSELAPRRLRGPVGALVELLAAIPSVVLGLWGILVFGPWVHNHLEPWIQDTPLGLLPVFSGEPLPGGSIFTAGLILTIMIIPITSAICRELFIRALHDAEKPMWEDIPWATPTPHWPFERFRQLAFESGQMIPDASVIAYDGETIAGLTTTGKRERLDGYTWMTGVGRDYRGRGLATALKVEALSRAKAKGLRAMLTTNDEPNKAMRELNAKLGYQMLPAHVQLEKPLLH